MKKCSLTKAPLTDSQSKPTKYYDWNKLSVIFFIHKSMLHSYPFEVTLIVSVLTPLLVVI